MQITENFNMGEFIVGGDPIPDKAIIQNLVLLANRLQTVRDFLNRKITVTSGYRTPEHNKAVGGESNSYHLKGMAADIVVDGMSARAFQQLMKHWSGGMGCYETFTHLDIGPRRRW